MNIKNRLLKLESNSLPTSEGINIVLVKLVASNEPKAELNYIWSSYGDEYFKSSEETDETFEERVYIQVRKTNNIDSKSCMILFGDTMTEFAAQD